MPSPPAAARGGTVTPVVGYPGSFVYTPSVLARMSAASSGPTTDTVTVTLTDGHGGRTPVEITVPVAPTGDTTTLPLILTNIGGAQVFVPGQFGTEQPGGHRAARADPADHLRHDQPAQHHTVFRRRRVQYCGGGPSGIECIVR